MTTTTIDITPSAAEQERLLRLFANNILEDVRKARKENDRSLMQGVISLVFTAGFNAGVTRDTNAGDALRTRLENII